MPLQITSSKEAKDSERDVKSEKRKRSNKSREIKGGDRNIC